MIFKHFQRAVDTVAAFLHNQSGSILIYTGAFMAVGVGGAALSIDIGRIVLLQTQMQNRADAGALAGAAQLDAQTYAIVRADNVVKDSMQGYTTVGNVDSAALGVYETIYHIVDPNDPTKTTKGPVTTDDATARFVEVILNRRTLSFFYAPALNILTGKSASSTTYLDAAATGMSDPFICKMQPLMVCNPYESIGKSLGDPAYMGFGIMLKQSPSAGAWQPGNFGLLDLPADASYGVNGANAVMAALSADKPLGCYAASTINTATGGPAKAIETGINVRWDGPGIAPNVIAFPRDNIMDPAHASYVPGTAFGDGVWDLAGYWNAKHPGVPMNTALNGATRYMIYLYEQGVPFYRKGTKDATFLLPGESVPPGGFNLIDVAVDIAAVNASSLPVYPNLETVPATFQAIPYDAGLPTDPTKDGWPDNVSDLTTLDPAYKRRVLTIAVANCLENSFQGASEIPSNGVYVELFITEPATAPSAGTEVVGEVVTAIEAVTSLEFHGNVRLVE